MQPPPIGLDLDLAEQANDDTVPMCACGTPKHTADGSLWVCTNPGHSVSGSVR